MDAAIIVSIISGIFTLAGTIISVPKGCCFNVSVENTSEAATATDPAPAINVQNANLTVARIA